MAIATRSFRVYHYLSSDFHLASSPTHSQHYVKHACNGSTCTTIQDAALAAVERSWHYSAYLDVMAFLFAGQKGANAWCPRASLLARGSVACVFHIMLRTAANAASWIVDRHTDDIAFNSPRRDSAILDILSGPGNRRLTESCSVAHNIAHQKRKYTQTERWRGRSCHRKVRWRWMSFHGRCIFRQPGKQAVK
jgi:hypothetical protein